MSSIFHKKGLYEAESIDTKRWPPTSPPTCKTLQKLAPPSRAGDLSRLSLRAVESRPKQSQAPVNYKKKINKQKLVTRRRKTTPQPSSRATQTRWIPFSFLKKISHIIDVNLFQIKLNRVSEPLKTECELPGSQIQKCQHLTTLEFDLINILEQVMGQK